MLDDETVREFGTFSDIKPTKFLLDPKKTIVGINVESVSFKSTNKKKLIFFA